jgi:hypothetical protein
MQISCANLLLAQDKGVTESKGHKRVDLNDSLDGAQRSEQNSNTIAGTNASFMPSVVFPVHCLVMRSGEVDSACRTPTPAMDCPSQMSLLDP